MDRRKHWSSKNAAGRNPWRGRISRTDDPDVFLTACALAMNAVPFPGDSPAHVKTLVQPLASNHRDWPPGPYPIFGFMSVPHLLVDADGAVALDTGLPIDAEKIRRTIEQLG